MSTAADGETQRLLGSILADIKHLLERQEKIAAMNSNGLLLIKEDLIAFD